MYPVGEEPTAEEVFYATWGREASARTLAVLAEAFNRLITLDTALLGGSIAFLGDRTLPPGFRIAAIVLLLASLCCALLGVMPQGGDRVATNEVGELRRLYNRVLGVRTRLLHGAAGSLVGAFAIALVGLAWRAISPAP